MSGVGADFVQFNTILRIRVNKWHGQLQLGNCEGQTVYDLLQITKLVLVLSFERKEVGHGEK